MQLLIGKRAFVARFAFPNDCRLVATRPVEMPVQTIFRNVEFAADKPLRERRLPFKNLFPWSAPDQFLRFARPEFSRLPNRFSIHSAILSQTLDGRLAAELPRWVKNALLDQM
jgi:hypothetical protein